MFYLIVFYTSECFNNKMQNVFSLQQYLFGQQHNFDTV